MEGFQSFRKTAGCEILPFLVLGFTFVKMILGLFAVLYVLDCQGDYQNLVVCSKLELSWSHRVLMYTVANCAIGLACQLLYLPENDDPSFMGFRVGVSLRNTTYCYFLMLFLITAALFPQEQWFNFTLNTLLWWMIEIYFIVSTCVLYALWLPRPIAGVGVEQIKVVS